MLCMGGGDYKKDKRKKKHEVIEFASDMELRDHFAGLAMQAMMISGFWNWKIPKDDVKNCYKQADAMMKERYK